MREAPSVPPCGRPHASPSRNQGGGMKKMRLDAEQLAVESFEPAPEVDAGRGTVQGNEATVTCIWRCGTVAALMTCYSGCTEDC